MKPLLFVIAVSHSGSGDPTPTLDVTGDFMFHAPPLPLRSGHMFDCSEEELSVILEWLRLEREAL